MAGNQNPIYSRVGDIQGSVILTTAALNDYTGNNINNTIVYQADPTNGGFLQRLRFKATGTNVATVARIYINEGYPALANTAGIPGTPSASVSSTGGVLQPGNYYAVVQSIDQYGIPSNFSAESTVATTTTNTSSIVYSWTPGPAAQSYRLFVGPTSGGQVIYFSTSNTSYTVSNVQPNLVTNIPSQGQPKDFVSVNMLYGELSLPATTGSGSAATVDVDYPMNIALPPSYHILCGLGTTVANGWSVTAIAGKY